MCIADSGRTHSTEVEVVRMLIYSLEQNLNFNFNFNFFNFGEADGFHFRRMFLDLIFQIPNFFLCTEFFDTVRSIYRIDNTSYSANIIFLSTLVVEIESHSLMMIKSKRIRIQAIEKLHSEK